MTEKDKAKVDWLAAVSSDEDEIDVEQVETEEVVQENKKTTVAPEEKDKPKIKAFNENQHARNKYKKKVKGGFKTELAQKKVVHLKASKNPFDVVGDSDQEAEQSGEQSEEEEQNQKETQGDSVNLTKEEDETEEAFKARVETFTLKQKERKEAEALEQKRLEEAIAKNDKLNEERAAAKAAKKEKKKKQAEEEDIDAILKGLGSAEPKQTKPAQESKQETKPTVEGADKKKKKNKPKPAQTSETKEPAPVQPEEILSIEEVLKRKAAKEAANKNAKKKTDLGAAKREIEERKEKQKVKKTDLDL